MTPGSLWPGVPGETHTPFIERLLIRPRAEYANRHQIGRPNARPIVRKPTETKNSSLLIRYPSSLHQTNCHFWRSHSELTDSTPLYVALRQPIPQRATHYHSFQATLAFHEPAIVECLVVAATTPPPPAAASPWMCASAMRLLAPAGASSPGLAMPYQATTMTPKIPVMQLKTSATMPRGVNLRRESHVSRPALGHPLINQTDE